MPLSLAEYIPDRRFLRFFDIAQGLEGTQRRADALNCVRPVLDDILGTGKQDFAYLYLRRGDTLRLVSCYGVPSKYYRRSDPTAMQQHPGYAFREASLLVNDVEDQRFGGIVKFPWTDHIPRALIVVPIKYGDEARGVLGIGSNTTRVYTSQDMEVLELAGRYIGIALVNKRKLTQSMQRANTPQRRTLLAAAYLGEAKDHVTGGHIWRVGHYAMRVAQKMGYNDEDAEEIRFAAMAHDTGKLRVPQEILSKPGPLDATEWVKMKKHPEDGAELISSMGTDGLRLAMEVARYHHERMNGSGYPRGLSGDAIPMHARITSVVDSFDAMTDNNRPYQLGNAKTPAQAFEIIISLRGTHFDSEVVDAFLALRPMIERRYRPRA